MGYVSLVSIWFILLFLVNGLWFCWPLFSPLSLILSVNNALKDISQIPMKLIITTLFSSSVFRNLSHSPPSLKTSNWISKILCTNSLISSESFIQVKSRNLINAEQLSGYDTKFPIFVYLFLSKDLFSCQRIQEWNRSMRNSFTSLRALCGKWQKIHLMLL